MNKILLAGLLLSTTYIGISASADTRERAVAVFGGSEGCAFQRIEERRPELKDTERNRIVAIFGRRPEDRTTHIYHRDDDLLKRLAAHAILRFGGSAF